MPLGILSNVPVLVVFMKNDGLLGRNFLKGAEGDAINVMLCGAGQNLRLILRHLRIFCVEIRVTLNRNLSFACVQTA